MMLGLIDVSFKLWVLVCVCINTILSIGIITCIHVWSLSTNFLVFSLLGVICCTYLSLTWFSLLVPYEKNESFWFNNAVLVLIGIQYMFVEYMFVDTIFIHVLILVVKTTGRPGVLRFMGSQRVGHNWVTDLIWSDLTPFFNFPNKSFNMAKKCLASVTYLTFIVYVVKWFYRV